MKEYGENLILDSYGWNCFLDANDTLNSQIDELMEQRQIMFRWLAYQVKNLFLELFNINDVKVFVAKQGYFQVTIPKEDMEKLSKNFVRKLVDNFCMDFEIEFGFDELIVKFFP